MGDELRSGLEIPVPSSAGLARKKDSPTVIRNVPIAGAVEVGSENPSGAIGGEQDEPGRESPGGGL